jgi:hypothetical protein
LSRACLGKLIVGIYNWLKTLPFSRTVLHVALVGVVALVPSADHGHAGIASLALDAR